MRKLRWGILGTGAAASKFAYGLRTSEQCVVAAVGSREPTRAREFAWRHGVERAHGSYEQLVSDNAVDAVYIATPPDCHRDDALLGLAAGKHVLVEKPFASSAEAAADIWDAAASASLFCMEAMWTRFLPAIRHAKQILGDGGLGRIRVFSSSFGQPVKGRPEGASGFPAGPSSLADRAVYPLSLAIFLLGEPLEVQGTRARYDSQSAATLIWSPGTIGTVAASVSVQMANDCTLIGDRGTLRIHAPIYRPSRLTVSLAVRSRGGPSAPWLDSLRHGHRAHAIAQRLPWRVLAAPWRRKHLFVPYSGSGMHYQADEAAWQIARGITESPIMAKSETMAVMRVMDHLRQGRTRAQCLGSFNSMNGEEATAVRDDRVER